MVAKTTELFKKESNLLVLQGPMSIIGDIHGQYYDLVRMMEILGQPESETFLFLGDYVDRGQFSIECLILLMVLKINYPDKMFMLRGNHECRELTSHFNFRTECLEKYDQEVYDLVMCCFDCLPLAALVNNSFLVLHGGLSPDLNITTDIDTLDRFHEPPQIGMFCDILWADPLDTPDGRIYDGFKTNDTRGCSFFYGYEACHNFLSRNNLVTLIRAHEAQIEGYKVHHWNNEGFPQVITIFSAPNYCDVYNNKAAYIQLRNNDLTIKQFHHVPHPYLLPNNVDLFSWSIPFAAEKLTDIFVHIIKITDDPNQDDLSPEEELRVEEIMKHPDIRKYLGGDELNSSILQLEKGESQIEVLEQILEKKKSMAEENENLIKNVDLSGSLISHQNLEELSGPEKDNDEGNPKIFNYVKEFDQVNEMRPLFKQ